MLDWHHQWHGDSETSLRHRVVLGMFDQIADWTLAPLRASVGLFPQRVRIETAIDQAIAQPGFADAPERNQTTGTHGGSTDGPVATSARDIWVRSGYRTLEPLLLQWPLVVHVHAQGQALSVEDILVLWQPLAEWLSDQALFQIGIPGESVGFEPCWHELTSEREAIEPGTPVIVRQVGYRHREQVLRRAKVTRPAVLASHHVDRV
jgi:hypothetical protein